MNNTYFLSFDFVFIRLYLKIIVYNYALKCVLSAYNFSEFSQLLTKVYFVYFGSSSHSLRKKRIWLKVVLKTNSKIQEVQCFSFFFLF